MKIRNAILAVLLSASAYIACTPLPEVSDRPFAEEIVGDDNLDAAAMACDAGADIDLCRLLRP
jgi:hypothetical protein